MAGNTLREGTAAEAGFDPDRIARIDERAKEWIERGPTRSLVLLAARRGVVALHESYGVVHPDSNDPLRRDAIFWAASMAKPVTATAIMLLVEDGELSLNRPLKDFFPELSGKNSDRILVHQLLTHTSGYADASPLSLPKTDVPAPEGRHPVVHAELQEIFAREPLKKPGEQNIYCNANFTLLGELVHRVSGQRLDAFIREHIFDPLGMDSSRFGGDPENHERSVPLRAASIPIGMSEGFVEQFIKTPNGGTGLHSTAGDLAIFAELYRRGGEYGGVRLLNDWTVAEMTRNQIPGIGCVGWVGGWIPEASWGLGWMVQGDARWKWSHGMLQPRGTYYHQGGSGCALWIDPVHDVVGVYLSTTPINFDTGEAGWEFDRFQNMLTAAVDHSV